MADDASGGRGGVRGLVAVVAVGAVGVARATGEIYTFRDGSAPPIPVDTVAAAGSALTVQLLRRRRRAPIPAAATHRPLPTEGDL